jgi:hypothetical protein
MAISGEPSPEAGDPPGGDEEDVASMAISGELGPEVGECPGGGEEDVVSMAISGEPGPEVGEPLPSWPPLFAPGSARSGNPFSPPARSVDSSMKIFLSAYEIPLTASPKDNKAVPAFHSRSKKTKNRRKNGYDAGTSEWLPHIILHQHISFSYISPFALLLRFCGVLARSSTSAGVRCFVS